MSLSTRLAARQLKLPPARTHRVAVERNITIPMPDGTTLRADRYYPRNGERVPLAVTTSSRNYRRLAHDLVCRLIAERGYQVLVRYRHTPQAEAPAETAAQDRTAGFLEVQAVVSWAHRQPWFPGVATSVNSSTLLARL
ncbi:hypothetical protein [Amycolatopsis nigrescens]|uniref:hypothetical protein n=1 Tax=Amycolatopsis nigrescens TaxID=381445 RepID=UPI00036F9C49|nr:hypothetical protein [Amycolatopsis nigrescens]